MFSGKSKIIALLFFLSVFFNAAYSQDQSSEPDKQKSLEISLGLLKRYFAQKDAWQVTREGMGESVRGLIHFIEKQHIDTILVDLNEVLADTTSRFVYRLPEEVSDSLHVPGYYPQEELRTDLEQLYRSLQKKYLEDDITIPLYMVSEIEEQTKALTVSNGEELLKKGVISLPDSLQIPEVIPDSLVQSPEDFRRYLQLDSLRDKFIEEKKEAYNDSVVWAYRDSVVENYRRQRLAGEFQSGKENLADSVRLNNYQVLKQYNDSIVAAVNDSISFVLEELTEYADYIDTTRLKMNNLVGEESSILLQNGNQFFSRVWLKNEQNDSLKIMVKNLDKKTIQLLIDDGVTFSRFKPKATKEFDFSTLTENYSGLTNVGEKYQVLTPWRIGGDGSVGFSQTYLNNWKKGGKSALSFLLALKGFANFSSNNGKVKWENSGEIRNGWIRPGGSEAELQKNEDKFELTSRLGLSAFKKWYYSAEFNYETQFFNGYKYPTSANPEPISAFMSPAKTFFKIGLDYKPNRNFSMLLSPLTVKNVYVRDTVKIDQTNFGIKTGEKGFWLPGLNADLKYKKDITEDITWETKYKMFINFKKPFTKFDINWENQMVMQLNKHINLRMMFHLIYDDDVLFPVYDAAGEKTGEEKPKLQVKEFFTIGFTYKINRQVTRTRRK